MLCARPGLRAGIQPQHLTVLDIQEESKTENRIASGGVGNPQHIVDVFKKTDVSAALAASIFHFNEYPVPVVKQCLKENGINIRE